MNINQKKLEECLKALDSISSQKSLNEIFQQIEDITDQYIQGVFDAYDVEIKNDQAILEKVNFFKEKRGQLPLSTGITDQILGISQLVLGFGAGGFALALGFFDVSKIQTLSIQVQKLITVGGIFYIELMIISLVVLILYMLQARYRYPFLYFEKIGNAWPFFYYSSISDDVPRRIDIFQTPEQKVKSNRLYAGDFAKFAGKCLSAKPIEWLRMEIQQYFLLISYQGYVNQFSLRLANIFMYGFIGTTITMIVFLVLVFAKIL